MSESNFKLQPILDRYSFELSMDNAVQLTKELIKTFKGNAPKIIQLKVKNLYDIIIRETDFVNQIPNHKFITNIRYFIDRRNEIICCSRCGQPLLVNLSLEKPYPAWHSRCNAQKYTISQFVKNSYYNENKEMFIELINELNRSPTGFAARLKCNRQDIVNWMQSQLAFLIDDYSIGYMIYCILNDMKKYPKCQNCGKDLINEKHFMGLYEGFHQYCSNYCAQTDVATIQTIENSLFKKYHRHVKSSLQVSSVRNKSIKRCLKLYGCTNGGASKQAQRKSRRKYIYDNVQFDSQPELAFYIWLKDRNIKFKYHPMMFFEYGVNGKTSRYYPDFMLSCGLIIEIKGIHFFENYNKNGKMIFPYNYRQGLSQEKINKLNAQYNAKHQCMIANNVIILTNDDYQQYIDYVKMQYGPKFMNKFRISSKQESQTEMKMT